MAKTALKEKLEEKLYQNGVVETEIIGEQNNIIPFTKTEEQLCSVVPEFATTLKEAKERIQMLKNFVKEIMIEGVDYGTIPKCDKPTLLKSGAEKLTDIFGFSKQIEILNRTEEWDSGLFHYEVKVILISKRTGLVEAEGIGCCNNREKKYINQHAFSVINTVLKMAKKRALVDAVLSATRSSSLFTQDIEDMEIIEVKKLTSDRDNIVQESLPDSNSIPNNPNPTTQNQKPATKNQLNKIHSLVTNKNIPVNRIKLMMKERYQVLESKYLMLKQADDFIKYLISNF